MLNRVFLIAAVITSCAGFTWASDRDDIQSAFQNLADSGYSWKSTSEGWVGAAETVGKAQKDGLTTFSITRPDQTFEVITKGNNAVVKTKDGWKSTSELLPQGSGGGTEVQRFQVLIARSSKPPVVLAKTWIPKVENIHKTEDGYTAEWSADAAKANLEAVGLREVSNPKMSVTIWVNNGTVSKFQIHETGSYRLAGNDTKIDRTATTVFTDVGTTKINIPDEANAKLTQTPTTRP